MKETVNIQLNRMQYVTTEMALKLYTQGCKVQCPGCSNKDAWDFKKGSTDLKTIEEIVTKYDMAIKRIIITGGEPLQQDLVEMMKLIKFLNRFDKEVWLFTSLEMFEIYPGIKSSVDFIKTGIYDPLSGPGGCKHGYKLSSSNQRIYKRGLEY